MQTIELVSGWTFSPCDEQEIHQHTDIFTHKNGLAIDLPHTVGEELVKYKAAKKTDTWMEEARWNLQNTFTLPEKLEKTHLILLTPGRDTPYTLKVGDSKPILLPEGDEPLFTDITALAAIGRNTLSLCGKGIHLTQAPRLIETDTFLLEESWTSVQGRGKSWKTTWHGRLLSFQEKRQSWKLELNGKTAKGSWDLQEGENLVEASISATDVPLYEPEQPATAELLVAADTLLERRTLGFASYGLEAGIPVVNKQQRRLFGVVGHEQVEDARAAGMRLILTESYQDESFYQACDQNGVLVLQQVAPTNALSWQVHRISSHPSLFGWYVKRDIQDGESLLAVDRKVQKELVSVIEQNDGLHPVLLSYDGEQPCVTGYSSYPSARILPSSSVNLTSPRIEEQAESRDVTKRLFGDIADQFVLPDSTEKIAMLSQSVQAMQIRQAVDRLRIQRKGMILVDRLTDPRHLVSSALIEQSGRWKNAMYALRDTLFQPARPAVLPKSDGSIELFAINDTKETIRHATLALSLIPYNGIGRPIQKKYVLTIPAGECKLAATLTPLELEDKRRTHFLTLALTMGETTVQDGLFLDKPKYCAIPESQITTTFSRVAKGIEVILKTKRPALLVTLDGGKLEGTFSRNWFSFIGTARVVFQSEKPYTLKQIKDNLSVWCLDSLTT